MAKRFLISIILLSVIYIAIGFIFDKEVLSTRLNWMLYPHEEDSAIKEAVILYNKIFTDLYVSNGVYLRLDDFPASKQLRHELYRTLGFLRDRNLIQIYDMADLAFKEIKMPSPQTAEVIAYEEWNYLYRKIPSRELAQSIKGIGQGFKYNLIKQKDRWVVVDYTPLDIKHEKKDEFYY